MPEIDANGWTLQALKQYFDQRFEAAERAVEKATGAIEYRLDAMNEYRQQLERERSEYVTVAKHDALDERIDELRRTYVSNERFDAGIGRLETRIGASERWQNKMIGALAFVGLIMPIVSALIVYWATHP